MSVQLELFQQPDKNYKVVRYFGRMIDTNGSEIYFVKTVKNGLTKYLAEKYLEELKNGSLPGQEEFFELVKEESDN